LTFLRRQPNKLIFIHNTLNLNIYQHHYESIHVNMTLVKPVYCEKHLFSLANTLIVLHVDSQIKINIHVPMLFTSNLHTVTFELMAHRKETQ